MQMPARVRQLQVCNQEEYNREWWGLWQGGEYTFTLKGAIFLSSSSLLPGRNVGPLLPDFIFKEKPCVNFGHTSVARASPWAHNLRPLLPVLPSHMLFKRLLYLGGKPDQSEILRSQPFLHL